MFRKFYYDNSLTNGFGLKRGLIFVISHGSIAQSASSLKNRCIPPLEGWKLGARRFGVLATKEDEDRSASIFADATVLQLHEQSALT